MNNLTKEHVIELISELKETLSRHCGTESKIRQCWQCDCVQGFLVQLKLDCSEDVSDLIDPLLKPKEVLHGCLGCDPCPGGERFANYIKKSMNS